MTIKDLVYMIAVLFALSIGLVAGDKIGFHRAVQKQIDMQDAVNTPGVYQVMPMEAIHHGRY